MGRGERKGAPRLFSLLGLSLEVELKRSSLLLKLPPSLCRGVCLLLAVLLCTGKAALPGSSSLALGLGAPFEHLRLLELLSGAPLFPCCCKALMTLLHGEDWVGWGHGARPARR